MSRLNELIEKYCQNGVEYKRLGEIGDFFSGLTGKSKEDFKDGNAKFITYRNIYSNPSLNLDINDKVRIMDGEKQNIVRYGDILFTGSSETPDECGMSSVVTEPTNECLYLNSFCFGLRLNNLEEYDLNFLKHLLRSHEVRSQIKQTASGVTRYNVSKKRFANVCIPTPPLEVQIEIAHILDQFSLLQAELQARQEQYEYYRNKLLSFNELGGAKWMTMSEICNNISSGKNRIKNPHGKYPVYGSTGIISYCESFSFSDTQILVARVGANAGYVQIAKGQYNVSDNALIIDFKKEFILKYVYYILMNMHLNKYAKGGGQPLITASELKKLLIPIPPLSEQKRIVSILDKFDALVNDLSQGLPAEIAAVQEQYEYYRNKLLSFPKHKLTA